MIFILDFIGDLIIEAWFELMQFIIPNKMASRKFRLLLKIIVYIFSGILYASIIIGVFAIINSDEYTRKIGMYMVFIPLGISIVQILIGILVKLKHKR